MLSRWFGGVTHAKVPSMNPGLDAAGVPIVLSICVLLFTVWAWKPLILGRPISTASLRSALSLTVSSMLQITFIFLVWKQALTLDYSLKFAALGAPFCVLALVLVGRGKQTSDGPLGPVLETSLGLAMWVLLITIH
jgi:hypothetical protein